MIVAWHACLCDPVVLDCGREDHTVGQLLDHLALDLLPRRPTLWIFVAAVLLQCGTPLHEFALRHQHVRGARVKIDAHAIARAQQGEPAAQRRLG